MAQNSLQTKSHWFRSEAGSEASIGAVLTLELGPDTDRTLPCFIGGSSMGEIMDSVASVKTVINTRYLCFREETGSND